MTKKERKLLKASEKLEKATQEYLKILTEVDKIMQEMPRQLVTCYDLEEKYFKNVLTVSRACVPLELLHGYLDTNIPRVTNTPGVTIYSED